MPEKVPTPDPAQVVQRGAQAASDGDIDGSLAPFLQASHGAIDEARVAAERIAGARG